MKVSGSTGLAHVMPRSQVNQGTSRNTAPISLRQFHLAPFSALLLPRALRRVELSSYFERSHLKFTEPFAARQLVALFDESIELR